MDGDLARRIVARHLDPTAVGSAREVPAIELFLPPSGVHVFEARTDSSIPQGVTALDDGTSWHLNDTDGSAEFLRRVAPRMDPLSVVLTLIRYRISELLGTGSVRLATRPDDLDPMLKGSDIPFSLVVEPGGISFTTASRTGETAGADRWTATIGDEPTLQRTPLARADAAGAS